MGKAVDKFSALVAADCGGLTATNGNGRTVAFDPILFGSLFQMILPVFQGWLQKCRERRQQKQDQQDQTPQQQLAAAHADPVQRAKNVAALQQRILQECKRGAIAERKRARQTGLPADLGRFSITADSAYRLADKMHAQAATMKPADADKLCAEIGLS